MQQTIMQRCQSRISKLTMPAAVMHVVVAVVNAGKHVTHVSEQALIRSPA
jgi:hypothetical protein